MLCKGGEVESLNSNGAQKFQRITAAQTRTSVPTSHNPCSAYVPFIVSVLV